MSIIARGLIFATHFPRNPETGDVAVIHHIPYAWTGIAWAVVNPDNAHDLITPWVVTTGDPLEVVYPIGSVTWYAGQTWVAAADVFHGDAAPAPFGTKWEEFSVEPNAAALVTGNWVVNQIGSDLIFSYGTSKKMRLTPTGDITVVGNVTGFGAL